MLSRRDLSGILYTVWWRTSASSCITVGTVAAACVTIACSCCSASALGLDAKKRTTASRTHSASDAIVGRETVADKGSAPGASARDGVRVSLRKKCLGGNTDLGSSLTVYFTKCVCVVSN